MTTFLIVCLALALVLAVLALLISRRPDQYTVTRSRAIAAPAAALFPLVSEFARWASWTPWLADDPQVVVTLSGPPAGVGAHYRWRGNKRVGEGTMAIRDSQAPSHVRIDLVFLKPFASQGDVHFTFVRVTDASTVVTWTMHGRCTFVAKLMHLLINMDAMIGGKFATGLASMEAAVLALPQGSLVPTAASGSIP